MKKVNSASLRQISVSQPVLNGNERQYVQNALDKNELSWRGRYVRTFEREFAAYVGTSHALTCSSGTAALHLALRALNVQPDDAVIVPALTYVATANAVRYCDALPTICDVDPRTWTISPTALEDLLAESNGHRVAGVIIVHLYGVPCDMDRLRYICAQQGLWIIEDAAQAFGARWNGEAVGSLTDIAAFSLFANKIITTGEGGMVSTSNQEFALRMAYLRGQCQDKPGEYFHSEVGFNYRMTNLQAALGLAQLEQVDKFLEQRALIGATYREEFAGKLECQYVYVQSHPVTWMFSVLLPHRVDRQRVSDRLARDGVETRPIFTPLSDLPMYQSWETTPVADSIYARGLNLPTHCGLTLGDVQYVIERVLAAVEAES